MRRISVLGLGGLLLLIGLAAGSPATAQDPEPATIAALQTTVARLSTSVARQSTQISELQTAVAQSPGTPVSSPTQLPEPQSLEITITFRADPENVESNGLGTDCQGAGRFDDFIVDADIAIYDTSKELLSAAEFVESELVHEGVVFHECEMRFLIEEIPYYREYLVGITNRSILTLDYAELEELSWELVLTYG